MSIETDYDNDIFSCGLQLVGRCLLVEVTTEGGQDINWADTVFMVVSKISLEQILFFTPGIDQKIIPGLFFVTLPRLDSNVMTRRY